MNSYMVDSPQPASISYMWNFGSLLGACLVIQIITGITLAIPPLVCSINKLYYMLEPLKISSTLLELYSTTNIDNQQV